MKVIKVRELQDVVYDRYPEVDDVMNELLYDVQPFTIVQCKNCKYYGVCAFGAEVGPNDFCSKGERAC